MQLPPHSIADSSGCFTKGDGCVVNGRITKWGALLVPNWMRHGKV